MTSDELANSTALYSETAIERKVEVFLTAADIERLKVSGAAITVPANQLPDFDPDDRALTVTVQRFGA
jgi:hypothetical protein